MENPDRPNDDAAACARALLDLTLPVEVLPGVAANLAALATHWRLVTGEPAASE